MQGNIVLNVNAFYAGDLDWLVSGTRTIKDMVIWGMAGYYGDTGNGNGIAAHININRMTAGGATGTYDGPNEGAGRGTGASIYGTSTTPSRIRSFFTFARWALRTTPRATTTPLGNGANNGGATRRPPAPTTAPTTS